MSEGMIGQGDATKPLEAALDAAEKLLDVKLTIVDFNGVFHCQRGHLLGHRRHSHKKNLACARGFSQKCIDHCRFEMNAAAQSYQRPIVHRCWKGLCEVVTPLRWRGTHVGLLYAGIWRDPDEDERISQTQFSEDFRRARNALQTLSDERREHLFSALPLIADGLLSRLEFILIGAPKQSRRDQIRLFLHSNFSTDVTLGDLAQELGLSRSRTSHVVRKVCGQSFQELLVRTRMDAAQALLLTSTIKVKEIALRVGIPNEYHFSRLFKRAFGLPPGRFRKERGGG